MDEHLPPAPPSSPSPVLPDLPPPPAPPQAPLGRPAAPRPKNHLRWLIISVAVVVAGAFTAVKVISWVSTPQTRQLADIETSSVTIGHTISVVNPIDSGLRSIKVTEVVRGQGALPLVGRAEDGDHERVAVELLVCAGPPFAPNGTVAMFLETNSGAKIFPDPSTETNSLLTTVFSTTSCKHTTLGFTVQSTTKIKRFSYLQFPYLRANWSIGAPSNGSRS